MKEKDIFNYDLNLTCFDDQTIGNKELVEFQIKFNKSERVLLK